MDGVIDVADAQLALQFFCDWLCIKGGNLTEEQQALGNVDGEMSVMQWKSEERVTPVSVRDAQIILIYYTKHLTDATVTMDVLLESLGIK